MLDIAKLRFRNFLSYGDYITEVDFTRLTTCTIIGQIKKGGVIYENKSNGAGKSTIINAILWCVFGRTMHQPMPGDQIINKFIQKDCWVQIILRNGDIITRTREMVGHNELLFEDASGKDRTMSTSREQQLEILRKYKLDWDILCGSVFMTQYGQPWLGMADPTRKKALERLLQVDRFNYRAKVAKEKVDKCVEERSQRALTAKNLRATLDTIATELSETITANANFETYRRDKITTLEGRISTLFSERDALVLPDLEDLKTRWALVDQVKSLVAKMEAKSNALAVETESQNTTIKNAQYEIDKRAKMIGKVCGECRQIVGADHVHNESSEYETKRDNAKITKVRLESERAQTVRNINETNVKMAGHTPSQTIFEASAIHREWASLDVRIKQQAQQIIEVEKESNPHGAAIERLQARSLELEAKAKAYDDDVEQYALAEKHFNYIYKFYHDRKKAKGLAVGRDIPYFNDRLAYYLRRVELDLKCEMDVDLSVKFTDTKYKFFSGGEQKRADLAFMFAVYDMVHRMYGPQCNIVVLDDVDGWVDDDGIDTMIDLIKEEIMQKVSTALIVSHTKKMHGQFANELRVTRDDDNCRMSTLEAVR